MKGKEFEKTITTINLVYLSKIGFDIKCKFEGKSGLLIIKF